MARLLLLMPETEDYLADSLFLGLRAVLGADCVDWPKCERMYDSLPASRRAGLYGRGFTLYGGLLPDIDVDRVHVLQRARRGEFDAVVVASVWQDWGLWVQHARELAMIVLDGTDHPLPFPWSPDLMRRPLRWMGIPRRRRAAAFYKRELARGRAMRPIAFSVPPERIVAEAPVKTRLLPSHIVDPEVAALTGASTSYAFADEDAYYADLRASRFGITVKRQGWDAMRHYEIAASGAIPCFRALERKPARCAPHGLVPGVNCLTYAGASEILARLETIEPEEEVRLRDGALAWARANSTIARAREFLDSLGLGT